MNGRFFRRKIPKVNALIKNKLIIFLKSLFYRINRHISPKWVEHANKDDIAFFHVRKEFALFKFADIHHALVITKAFFSFRGGEGKVFNRCLHSLSVFLAEILHSCKMHESTTHVNGFVFDSIFSVGKYFVRMLHAHRVCKPKPVFIRKKENTL